MHCNNGLDFDYDKWEYEAEEAVCECLLEYSFLYSCPVKVLEITECSGTKGELEQMKHFLEKLSCLELVKVGAVETNQKKQRRLTVRISGIVKCKIQVYAS